MIMASSIGMGSEISYRDALESDLSFVLSSWLRSYAGSGPAGVSPRDYYAGHHDLLIRLLAHAQCKILCASSEPDTILGYCAYEPEQICHYLYLRPELRRKRVPRGNVAMRLIEQCLYPGHPIVASHRTEAGDKLAARHGLEIVYNPYPAYLAGYRDPLGQARKEYIQWRSKSSESPSRTSSTA